MRFVISIVKAEHMKMKRSISAALIWAFPFLVFCMAFVFTLGMTNAYAESVWNWWYALLLPGMLAIISYLSMRKEKKTRYYNFMTLSTSKKKLMMGKIIYLGCVILVSNIIIFTGASLGGFLLTTSVPVRGAAIAILVLTITQLWEIPLYLFLSERFGMIVELLVCMFLTVGGVLVAPSGKWYFFPSAIPMRVLCPLIHVLPNGIRAEAGNPLLNVSVVLPGICLSILWFVIVTILFLRWFDKMEVK